MDWIVTICPKCGNADHVVIDETLEFSDFDEELGEGDVWYCHCTKCKSDMEYWVPRGSDNAEDKATDS